MPDQIEPSSPEANSSRPINIHILPRPLCTCTMCSSGVVPPSLVDDIQMTVRPDISQFREQLQRLGEQYGAALGYAAAGMRHYFEAMETAKRELRRRANLPVDGDQREIDETPHERAIRLRRTRNTGPRQRSRAPRRIDARRTR